MEPYRNPEYWLRWEVGMCFLSVLASIGLSIYVLRRYEGPGAHLAAEAGALDGERGPRSPGVVYADEAWRPYVQNLDPRWLLAYRLACFLFFTVFTVIIVESRGPIILWTFLLVTIYFGVATSLSFYHWSSKIAGGNNGEGSRRVAGFDGYLLQIIYQTCAGAVMLTDCVFWCIIFPNLLIEHHRIDFHFPWFRIAYFSLWTCAYVIFQWIIHASTRVIWPYPFLDLSSKLAPLWSYLVVGVLQVPCYLLFGLMIKLKKRLHQSLPAPVHATA